VLALQSLGLGAETFARLRSTIAGSLLGAERGDLEAFGPGAAGAFVRLREESLGLGGVGVTRFQAPRADMRAHLFGEMPVDVFGSGPSGVTGLSSVNDLRARQGAMLEIRGDALKPLGRDPLGTFTDRLADLQRAFDLGAITEEEFGKQLEALNRQLEEAAAKTEAFGKALVHDAGGAIEGILRAASGRGGAGGIFAAGSSILSGAELFERKHLETLTLSLKDAKTPEERASIEQHVLSASKLIPTLGIASTSFGVVSELLSGLGSLFNSGLSIKDYGPVALEQLRALMVPGGIVALNITNAGGMDASAIQNTIARQTARDSIPRFPQQPVGAGR